MVRPIWLHFLCEGSAHDYICIREQPLRTFYSRTCSCAGPTVVTEGSSCGSLCTSPCYRLRQGGQKVNLLSGMSTGACGRWRPRQPRSARCTHTPSINGLIGWKEELKNSSLPRGLFFLQEKFHLFQCSRVSECKRQGSLSLNHPSRNPQVLQ